jgi:Amidohydrolase family/WD40-like Beta Propeller Repeat
VHGLPRIFAVIAVLAAAVPASAQVTLTRGTNFSVDVAADGRLAIDLLGRIWVVPAKGGVARQLEARPLPARRPRWSPDANSIVYQARSGNREALRLYRFADGSGTEISDGHYFDEYPSWHPSGERIVYSSDRDDSGFDLWELDLPTRLTWRLTSTAGDETEAAWSADGRDLAWIHHDDAGWSLMLRRQGRPDVVLASSDARLAAPSWRPDGSLVTFLQHTPSGLELEMAILSDPPLVRALVQDEDFFYAPVAWRDRNQFLYTANGVIRSRPFDSWTSKTLPFRATLEPESQRRGMPQRPRQLADTDPPDGRLVLRAARLFDGTSDTYREGLDIVIDGATITALEAPRDRSDAIVVDMGDLTVLPGVVDAWADLPATPAESLGPLLLSYGVTTVVTSLADPGALNRRWSGKEMPGPRVLGSDWRPDLDSMNSLVPGAGEGPTSPRGIRYENAQIAAGPDVMPVFSGLADARTPGLPELMQSRQAALLGRYPTAIRRYTELAGLTLPAGSLVLASAPNGLPPGIAQQAELRAMVAAGSDPAAALEAAGENAAAALGVAAKLGRIAPGACADLVIVDGDPLADVDDAARVVGVVRNGRFFSAIGLIERARAAGNVE